MIKTVLLWALRLFIGGLFLYSGFIKLMDPHTFAESTANYQMIGNRAVILTALYLPWLEIWTGLALLLFPPLRTAAWSLITLMLLVFTAAKISALARGLDISCGCGTGDDPMTLLDVLENLALLAVTITGLFIDTATPTPPAVPPAP
ncbi:MAG: DoxX family membrane protein [Verrucomicrobia bacterium]|nr:DoxX family membrane protein [Verrucomicrobiota bacterium]MCH8525799.1 DoxX family membrane protein [Kiritimatiellia bacterium]